MSGAAERLALDTNVLLRTLVRDDERQTAAVARFLRDCDEAGTRLLVPSVVLCEAVWVLESWYRFARAEIAGCLDQVLLAPGVEFEDRGVVERALAAYRAGRGDFADYLIREVSRAAGCAAVVTFERALAKEEGFRGP